LLVGVPGELVVDNQLGYLTSVTVVEEGALAPVSKPPDRATDRAGRFRDRTSSFLNHRERVVSSRSQGIPR